MSDEPIELAPICVTPDGPCEDGSGAGGDGDTTGQGGNDDGQRHGTARHAGNADTQWRAVTSAPDFCRVGDRIVGFDSSATLGTPVRHSPDVILAGQPGYRVGDLCRGIQGDAGSGIVSGTSGGSGHVRFLEGQSNVKVNGQPLVRDGNPCLINCNAAGTGGAQGYVQTTTRGARSQLAGGGTPSVAERLQQQAGDYNQQADDLRQQLNTAPNGKTHAETLALQERVNQLNAETQQLRQALYDAAREGELRGDALSDALFDVEEATNRARDLTPEADRQVRYTSGAGQTARAIGEFGAETFTPYGTAVDLKDTWELFATGQYGAAIGMTALTAISIFPPARGVRKAAEGIDDARDLARGADAAEEAAGGARRGEAPEGSTPPDDGVMISRKASNHEKAAFGEARAHETMTGKGYEPIGRTDGVYQQGQTGIDGLYRNPNPPPDFVVTEAKFGKGRLGRLKGGIKQMDNKWVEQRLADAVDPEANPALYDDVMESWDAGRIDKYLVRVKPDGTSQVKALDKSANIIGDAPGF